MSANTAVAIVNTALLVLIGFLCWLFNHWWPVFLIVGMMSSEFRTGVRR